MYYILIPAPILLIWFWLLLPERKGVSSGYDSFFDEIEVERMEEIDHNKYR